jgi:hypothetical protein
LQSDDIPDSHYIWQVSLLTREESYYRMVDNPLVGPLIKVVPALFVVLVRLSINFIGGSLIQTGVDHVYSQHPFVTHAIAYRKVCNHCEKVRVLVLPWGWLCQLLIIKL